MPAADKTYNTPNYESQSGAWHIGGVLELGDSITLTVNANGVPILANVPTADPHVVGALWASAGVLTISAG